jgi:hypothetical protein
MQSSFELQPFSGQSPIPPIQIEGQVVRHAERLSIRYILLDPKRQVIIPKRSLPPARQHNLWATTCLEIFFGSSASTAYWEVNLSPTGHWNFYHFDDYRSGMCEEAAISLLPFLTHHRGTEFDLQIEIELQPFVLADQALDIGISAVIDSRDHQLSYWALAHPGAEADFHRRDSFILQT